MGEILTVLVTAEQRGLDPNIVRPGWLALGIVAALGVAVFLLSKSFAKHAKKAAQPWEGERDESSASARSSRDDVSSRGSAASDQG